MELVPGGPDVGDGECGHRPLEQRGNPWDVRAGFGFSVEDAARIGVDPASGGTVNDEVGHGSSGRW